MGLIGALCILTEDEHLAEGNKGSVTTEDFDTTIERQRLIPVVKLAALLFSDVSHPVMLSLKKCVISRLKS